jgi:hypothetical protein
VLWRCLNCPKHPVPIPERGINKNAPITIVHFKVQFIKCSRHGVLTLNANKCIVCENQTADQKLGKILTGKELTLLSLPIGNLGNSIFQQWRSTHTTLPILKFFQKRIVRSCANRLSNNPLAI